MGYLKEKEEFMVWLPMWRYGEW